MRSTKPAILKSSFFCSVAWIFYTSYFFWAVYYASFFFLGSKMAPFASCGRDFVSELPSTSVVRYVVVLTWTHGYNQSVVTGQAPITLEQKIISGGKQIKTEDNTHNNWNKSYTSDKNKKVRSALVRIKDTCVMLNESQQKPKPRRQHSAHHKRQDETSDCPNRNRKREGREERNKDKSKHQQRKKEEKRQHSRVIRILEALARSAGGV